jgi:putative ABC transport system permease protein
MSPNLILKVSFSSLARHKTRTFLTTLGIIIGTMSIIAVMSLGEGAKHGVKKEIERLGVNFILALSKPPKQRMMLGSKLFKQSTLDTIVKECSDISLYSPIIIRNEIAVYEGSNIRTNVVGTNDVYFDIRKWTTKQGKLFSESDTKSSRKVAILGKTAAEELFFGESPVGKTVRIKKIPFKVIGVLDEKGVNPGGNDEDDTIFIPLKTMQRKIAGVIDKFAAIIFSVDDKNLIKKTTNQISEIIKQERRIDEGEEEDFTLFTQDDISQTIDTTYKILNLLLLAIASIALVVGGIGIMNIMLVSVTERTREIGIRMALGAKQHHILNQFLLEAVTICLFGGILGLIGGVGLAAIISNFFSWGIIVSKFSIFISILSSALIGIFFGFYPAYKASNLNPVDALAER